MLAWIRKSLTRWSDAAGQTVLGPQDRAFSRLRCRSAKSGVPANGQSEPDSTSARLPLRPALLRNRASERRLHDAQVSPLTLLRSAYGLSVSETATARQVQRAIHSRHNPRQLITPEEYAKRADSRKSQAHKKRRAVHLATSDAALRDELYDSFPDSGNRARKSSRSGEQTSGDAYNPLFPDGLMEAALLVEYET